MSKSRSDQKTPTRGRRALVVDDEEPLRLLLEQVLKAQGVEVVAVATGEAALDCLRAQSVDLVFLDIRLPDLDGIEVLRQALVLHPQLKIVIMTGHGDAHQAVTAMRLGAVEYLTKPFDLRHVQKILRLHLLGGFVEAGQDLLALSPSFEEAAATVPESRVLVVDDELAMRQLLGQVINQIGCQATTVSSAAAAKDMLGQQPFELVISDVRMPDENGVELLQWVKRHHPTTEVVLITGYPSLELAVEALRGGASDFLTRPLPSLDEMIEVIKRALRRQVLAEGNLHLTEELRHRHFELELLYKVSNAISYTISHEVLVNLIMESLAEAVPFDVSASLLVAPEKTLSVYLNGKVFESCVEPVKQQLVEAFEALSNERVQLSDYKLNLVRLSPGKSDRFGSTQSRGKAGDTGTTQTFFNVPILVQGRPIGMLSIISFGGRRFGETEVRLVSTVVNQMTGAIARIREIITSEESKMTTIVENMAEGVIMLDQQDEVAVMNPRANHFLSQLDKHRDSDAHPKEQLQTVGLEELVQAIKQGKVRATKEMVSRGSATAATISAEGFPVQDAQGRRVGIVLVLRDITEEKRVMQMKDEFVSSVSHELRTPLTSIKEGVCLVLDGVSGAVNDKQRRFLDIVRQDVDRLTELITNLLDLSKIEAGKVILARRRLQLAELLQSTCQSYQRVAGKRKIIFPQSEGPAVFADPNRIIQIVTNLLSNAMKFTKEDGTIAFSCQAQDGIVAVSVQDDGVGIAEDDLPKLFKRFSQVGEGQGRTGGTGLGLALCKQLVELHKGTIGVTSTPGQGATFTFTLPIYTSKLALEEYFEELLAQARLSDQEGVGLMAIDGGPFSGRVPAGEPAQPLWHLEQVATLLRKNVHRGDIVLTVEPQWIVILAVTDASGLQAMLGRLRPLVREWADQLVGAGARIPVNLGAAVYPMDGTDVHSLFAKATSEIKAE